MMDRFEYRTFVLANGFFYWRTSLVVGQVVEDHYEDWPLQWQVHAIIIIIIISYYWHASVSSSGEFHGISGIFGGGLLGSTVEEEVNEATYILYVKLYHTLTLGVLNGVTYLVRMTYFDVWCLFLVVSCLRLFLALKRSR
jgi:hypothetical protein